MKKFEKYIKYILPIIFWGIMLHIGSTAIGNDVVLPSPLSILNSMRENILDFYFWKYFSNTLVKIFSGLLFGILLGAILGFLSFRFKYSMWIFEPFMNFIKTTPVAALTIILLVWFNSTYISFNLVVLIVLPQIFFSVLYDLKNLDKDIREMIKVFFPPSKDAFLKVYLKEILISIYRSLPIVLGFAWKSGVSGEIISQAKDTFGNQIYMDKIHLEISDLFAKIFLLIVLTFILEKIIIYIYKKLFDMGDI